jgi:hypothetical protein
MEEF